ncbi:MAG: hypothetical protein QM770_14755 [Tepidisphaeraceae bacterium]
MSKRMIGFALAGVLMTSGAVWSLADRTKTDEAATANQLRSIGQALILYSNENKAWLPASIQNERLQELVGEQGRALLADPALIAPLMHSGLPTKITKLKPAAKVPLMYYLQADDSLLTLFADGHVGVLVERPVAALPAEGNR